MRRNKSQGVKRPRLKFPLSHIGLPLYPNAGENVQVLDTHLGIKHTAQRSNDGARGVGAIALFGFSMLGLAELNFTAENNVFESCSPICAT